MTMTEEEVRNLVVNGKVRNVHGLDVSKELAKNNKEKKKKYNNNKVIVDGIKFDSQLEADRYKSLKLLEKAGAIKDLQLQVPFELQPSFKYQGKTIRKITYKADFVYYDVQKQKTIVEDTKGFVTKEYALKRKMLLFKFPDIEFKEVYRKN